MALPKGVPTRADVARLARAWQTVFDSEELNRSLSERRSALNASFNPDAISARFERQIVAMLSELLVGKYAVEGQMHIKEGETVNFVQDIRTVDEMNKIWDAWVPSDCAPARACIEARLQSPAKMIEIRVIAAR